MASPTAEQISTKHSQWAWTVTTMSSIYVKTCMLILVDAKSAPEVYCEAKRATSVPGENNKVYRWRGTRKYESHEYRYSKKPYAGTN
jgi:hypothetical protein